MKKTSYIIFALIGLAIICSAAMPSFILKKIDINIHILKLEGKPITFTSDLFYSIDFDDTENISFKDETDVHHPLYITIIETDSLTKPTFVMDKVWKDNITVKNENGSMLLSIDMKEPSDKSGEEVKNHYYYGIDEANLGKLYVPRDMLHKVRSYSVKTFLTGFRNANMDISGNIDVADCSFSSLKF